MTKNTTKETLKAELTYLQQIASQINNAGGLHIIDRDIALAKIRGIYELFASLPATSDPVTVSKPASHTNLTLNTVDTSETIPHPVIMMEDEPEISLTKNADKPTISNTTTQTPINKKIVETSKEKTTENKISTTASAKKTILAEQFGQTKFLNDVFAKYSKSDSLSNRFENQPINDISTIIGVNDKILYIRELFAGDAQLYKATIDKINTMSNFNEAARYIDGFFKWEFEKPAVKKFFELVHRRFIDN